MARFFGVLFLVIGLGAGVALVLWPQLLNQRAMDVVYSPNCLNGATQCSTADNKTLQICIGGYLYPANCPNGCVSSGGSAGCSSQLGTGGGGIDTSCITEVYGCPGKMYNGTCLDIADSCPTAEVAAAIAAKPVPTPTPQATKGTSGSQEGYLSVLVEDDFNNRVSREKYFIQDSFGVVTPIIYNGKLNIPPGSRVKIDSPDYRSGTSYALPSPDKIQIVDKSGVVTANPVSGGHRIAVILANFKNLSTTSPTSPEAKTLADTKLTPFHSEMSFGKSTFTADIYGWVTMNISATCDIGVFGPAAIAAADPWINFNNYQYVMVVFPNNSPVCGFGGVAYLPPGITYSTGEGQKRLLVSSLPNDYYKNWLLNVGNHELGHSMGLRHAAGWECGATTLGTNCTSDEYGDVFDVMGGSYSYIGHYGTFSKEFLQWITSQNTLLVKTSGTYSLNKIETATTGKQSIKIPREGTNTYYNIENRTATGVDATLPPNAISGALIKIIPGTIDGVTTADRTYILDANPEVNGAAFSDAGYALNQTFTDPDRGIRITPLSKVNDILSVKVEFYGPTLLSPANGATYNPTNTFTWAPIPMATSYRILIASDTNFSNLLVDSVVNGTSYTAPALPTNQTLYWTVQANYSFGSSDFSAARSLKYLEFTNLSGTFSLSSATFNFTYPVSGTFTIEMANTADFSVGIYRNFGTGSSSPIVVTNPTKWTDVYKCGANLWWRVVAEDGNTSRIVPALVDCPTLAPVPITPANNIYINPAGIYFDWSDVIGATGYQIQIGYDSSFSDFIDINATRDVSNYLASKTLQGATKFYWRVRSRFKNGSSNWWSNVYSFTTAYPPYSPNILSPANGSMAVSNRPTLTWTSSGGAAGISGYRLQVTNDRTFSSFVVDTQLGNITSYQIQTALNAGTQYYWRVRSVDSIGQTSLWSSYATFTTPSAGDIPQTVTYQISMSNDDYNVNCDGTTTNNASNLTLGARTDCAGQTGHTAGMVFRNVKIPRYSGIVDAHLEMVASGNNTSDFTLYETVSGGGLSATTEWPIATNWNNNSTVVSANFADSLGRVVGHTGWESGTPITLKLSFKDGSGRGTRSVKSYDGSPVNAAKLVVTYIPKSAISPTPTPAPSGTVGCTVTVSPLVNMSNQPVLTVGQYEETTSVSAVTTVTGGSIASVNFEVLPFWNSSTLNFDVCSSSNSICPTFSGTYTDTTFPFNAKITSKYNHNYGQLKVTAVMNTGDSCTTTVMMGGNKPSCFTFKDQNGNVYQDNIPWNLKSGNTYTLTPTNASSETVTHILWGGGLYDSSGILRTSSFLQGYPLPVTFKPVGNYTSYRIIAGRPNFCKVYSYYTVK